MSIPDDIIDDIDPAEIGSVGCLIPHNDDEDETAFACDEEDDDDESE